MWTVVCNGKCQTTDIETSAQSWLDFALQVDSTSFKREATFTEVNDFNKLRAGKVYSGSEPNGDSFEASRNEAGELCLFANNTYTIFINGKRYEAYWTAGPYEVRNVLRQITHWGYDIETPNQLGDGT